MQEFDPDSLLQEMAVKSASEASGVSPNKIKNVIRAEGSGPSAISPKGAQGTMQLMPPIQKAYGVTNPNDPTQNINAGTKFLADLTRQYRQMYPNISDAQLEQAVYAHYNGGWKNGKAVAEGKDPVSAETKAYLNKINEVNPDDLLTEMSASQISQENVVLPESLGSSSKFAVDKYKSQGRVQPEQPGFTPYIEDKTAPRVAANSAVRSLSAGFIQPEWATKEETLAHPGADVLGSAAGFAPYTLVPGGLPTAMGVSGLHSGVQTAAEGGSPTDIALATGIGTAAPGVGRLLGKGASLAGKKIIEKGVNYAAGGEDFVAKQAAKKAELDKLGNFSFSRSNFDPSAFKSLLAANQQTTLSGAATTPSLTKDLLSTLKGTAGGAIAGASAMGLESAVKGEDIIKGITTGAIVGGGLMGTKKLATEVAANRVLDSKIINNVIKYVGNKTIENTPENVDKLVSIGLRGFKGNTEVQEMALRQQINKIFENRAQEALINKASNAQLLQRLGGIVGSSVPPMIKQ